MTPVRSLAAMAAITSRAATAALLGCVLAAAAVAADPAPEVRALGATVTKAILGADADLRDVALDRARHGLKGEWFTRTLADEVLPAAAPAVQVSLVSVLADRGDASALPAITKLHASSGDAAVRAACVLAIGRLGGPAEVAAIAKALAAGDPEAAAARRALEILRGTDTPAAIRAAATAASGGTRAAIIDVLSARRDRQALADMVAATGDADAAVRQAGVRGVARLGGPDQVAGLVQNLIKAKPGSDRDEVEKAVVLVCTQNPGREQSAEHFLAAFKAAGETDRETLLPTLGRIGGPAALAIVDGLVADPASRRLGLAALTRWPDATVKDRLLELFAKSSDDAEKKLVLAALIRIAPLPDNKLNDAQKLELLKKTMDLCQRDEDRAKVLERANAICTVDTFRFVVPYLDDPNLAESACRSVVELAHHQKLRDANKDEFMRALDKVLGLTKNEELVDRANRYKAGQTWERGKKKG
jgi:HEAT repeat protein